MRWQRTHSVWNCGRQELAVTAIFLDDGPRIVKLFLQCDPPYHVNYDLRTIV
jgi:hypothetical protein